MSIKTSIEQLSEPIGFDISHSDDFVQSGLLNGLGRGFKQYPNDRLEMQLCYVSQKLTKDAEDIILTLSEFIKLKNK